MTAAGGTVESQTGQNVRASARGRSRWSGKVSSLSSAHSRNHDRCSTNTKPQGGNISLISTSTEVYSHLLVFIIVDRFWRLN